MYVDAKDGGASTGLSPHRKQQRFRQSSCVSTRGLVPVFSPNRSAGGAASCSPAGAAGPRQRGIDSEGPGIYFVVYPWMPFDERACGTCPVVAVMSKVMRQTGENWQD